jgi:hemerythrin-like domain-containing protein
MTAKALREAGSSSGPAETFLDFWHDDGKQHFRIEEEVLLPNWARHAEVHRPSVSRMLEEHLAIRRYAFDIESNGLSVEHAHQLGELLEDHVRFEERELFPLIEAELSDDALAQLAVAIEEAESGAP